MSLLSRLLRRLLPGLIDAAVDEVEELSAPTQRSVPLSHKDSERQAAASRGPFTTAHCPVVGIGCLGCDFCMTSPRAITTRHCIPPPKPPRKQH